jgi:glyceraldehyde-3-phosphate dehydrogenase (NADP+)
MTAVLTSKPIIPSIKTDLKKVQKVLSPLTNDDGSPVILGSTPLMSKSDAISALDSAVSSYDCGLGKWASSSLEVRIKSVEKFNDYLAEKRDDIANLLMWEICKTKEDAYKEVDRTIEYMQKTIEEAKKIPNKSRAPLGTVLLLGPSNYPINETLTVMLPALLMGNSVIIKTPKVGALAVLALSDGFKTCFPEGVVSVLSGDGQELITPIIESGKLNAFCFIGGTNTAKRILSANPIPNKLKLILGLGAKNPGVILPDANLKLAASECVKGSLSFNGQRCTALKVLFVHRSVADDFARLVKQEVESLKCGNPWDEGVKITPIEPSSISYMQDLIEDAIITSGSSIINKNGGKTSGNLFTPAVLYPVTTDSKVANEEQFGPVVPIIPFDDESEVIEWMKNCPFAQQISLFTSNKVEHQNLISAAGNIYSRVNFNQQCQRGPDNLPFTGTRDSGMGVLSIDSALAEFSRPVVFWGE